MKDDLDAQGQKLGTWLVGDLLVILEGVQTAIDLTTAVTIMPTTARPTLIGSIVTSTVWVGGGTPVLPSPSISGTTTVYVLYGKRFITFYT